MVQAIARADEVLIRARPTLAAGKYQRMAGDPYSFFRGSLALFRADWEAGRASRSGFLSQTQPVLGLGDPHPENVGLLVDRQQQLALEFNDFDSADRVPYLFDVRRLLAGLALGARLKVPAADASGIARAGAAAYVTELRALADGAEPRRLVDDQGALIVQDLFRRGRRDLAARAELENLSTTVDAEGAAVPRRLLRGVLDPAEPTAVLSDVAPALVPSLDAVVAPLGRRVLDRVRQFGSGVASWPRVRYLLLLEGDAPGAELVVEVKELAESPLAGWYRPTFVAADTPGRVEGACRRVWAIPDADPRWFTTTWRGLPVQVRTESEAQKGVRVSRWVDSRGTEAELTKLAQVLGALLARAHSRSEAATVRSVVAQLARDPEAFADEQAAFADAEAQGVLLDFERFGRALTALGPTLGVVTPPPDAPSAVLADLFGVAP